MKTALLAVALLFCCNSAQAQWTIINPGMQPLRPYYGPVVPYRPLYTPYRAPLYGTSTRVGNMMFHNFSDGSFGTSTRVGNHTFHNFTPGYRYDW